MDFPHCFPIHLSISVFIFFSLLVVGSLDVVLCAWNTERANLADATCFYDRAAGQVPLSISIMLTQQFRKTSGRVFPGTILTLWNAVQQTNNRKSCQHFYSFARKPMTYECMHNIVSKSHIVTEASYYFAHRNSTVCMHAEINTIMFTAFQRVNMVPGMPRAHDQKFLRNCCVTIIKIDSGSWPAARS